MLIEKIKVAKRIGFGLTILNFIVQRIFRVNARCNYQVNFTSRVVGKKLTANPDVTTLMSFATSPGFYIQSVNEVVLGKNFLFGPGVRIISANHSKDQKRNGIAADRIEIGDNVWLGANVIVLPGVKIANGVTVGAGTVVTKSLMDVNGVYAGNPPRKIG